MITKILTLIKNMTAKKTVTKKTTKTSEWCSKCEGKGTVMEGHRICPKCKGECYA